MIAVIVAAALAGLLLLSTLGFGLAMAARAVTGGDGERVFGVERDDRAERGPFGPGPRMEGERPDRERIGPMVPGLRGLGAVQHGEFTMTGSDGRPVIMLVQRGEVTRASATSVTVRSTDNFSATYAVNNETRLPVDSAADLRAGDRVVVLARKQGSVAVLIQTNPRS